MLAMYAVIRSWVQSPLGGLISRATMLPCAAQRNNPGAPKRMRENLHGGYERTGLHPVVAYVGR